MFCIMWQKMVKSVENNVAIINLRGVSTKLNSQVECNKLSRNSVLEIQLERYINKSKLTVMPDLHRQGNRMMMKLDF